MIIPMNVYWPWKFIEDSSLLDVPRNECIFYL